MESHPLIYIRTDGNEITGASHLLRCLTIARALHERDALPVFIVSDQTSLLLLQALLSPDEIQEHTYPIIHLQTDYQEPEKELPVMLRLLSSHDAACCLIDTAFATPKYLTALTQNVYTAFLDDVQTADYPVSLIINYDICSQESFYKNAGRALTGADYVPLRTQFSRHSCHIWNTVKDILIYSGGTDPFGVAPGLLRRLSVQPCFEDVCFHVLTGPLSVHRAELDHLSRQLHGIQLHENVTDMAGLMAGCDMALAPGGSILYELCAVGLPSLSYSVNERQAAYLKSFHQTGLIPRAGDIRNNPGFFDQTVNQLCALAQNPAARREQSMQMRMTVDGAGAYRIAAALLKQPPA